MDESKIPIVHYTSWESLQGIVENRCLWASHIRFMNDSTEYQQAQTCLRSILPELAKKWLQELATKNASVHKQIDIDGGIDNVALRETETIIRTLYQVTGDEFYVTSFCGLPSDNYTAENGLLSQWRGYGETAAVAIFFDKHKIEELLKKETSRFSYATCFLEEVIYDDDMNGIGSLFRPKAESVFAFTRHLATVGDRNKIDQALASRAMSDFFFLSTFLKHRAFKEEKEIRLVVSRVVHNSEYLAEKERTGHSSAPEKGVHFRTKNGRPVPFIILFDGLDTDLPISRIVVGPGRHKEHVARAVEKLLSHKKVTVAISDIPLI